jgi:hypothetical protein
MSFFRKLFNSYKQSKPSNAVLDAENFSAETFMRLKSKARMVIVMKIGDSGQQKYFHILKYALLHDYDSHVKFAVLKRIHLFKGHPELEPLLLALKQDGRGSWYEPYFSMALCRLNLISLQELETVING